MWPKASDEHQIKQVVKGWGQGTLKLKKSFTYVSFETLLL